MDAQNAQLWIASVVIDIEPNAAQIGGIARFANVLAGSWSMTNSSGAKRRIAESVRMQTGRSMSVQAR